ncbi:Na(+)/H(+) antiporter subunit G [Stieleria maiorica]|uniref:Na(+)/H(+) antiporter subunit G n=1 Tax=Stieleria maiorica TaxID=2795974 RepID=A0A5B9MDD9_9BACT|nr:monovalent cation/H(+) antiporter subunit G [Stieleria maiorica]QEF99272.1 Na(+)/H(+) antiporter subunit G [Stieleria maiorica]
MSDLVTILLLITGTCFALLAAVAVVRMPDLYTRMHGATKSATLGVGCTVLSAAVGLANMETTTVAILIIGFLFVTSPVAAHMIGRAAYRQQSPMWKDTVIDESPRGPSETDLPDDQGDNTL